MPNPHDGVIICGRKGLYAVWKVRDSEGVVPHNLKGGGDLGEEMGPLGRGGVVHEANLAMHGLLGMLHLTPKHLRQSLVSQTHTEGRDVGVLEDFRADSKVLCVEEEEDRGG